MNVKTGWFPISIVGATLVASAVWVTSMATSAEQESTREAARLTSFTPGNAQTSFVPDGDLNLASQRDRDKLHARTRQAADSTCGRADVMNRLQVRAEAECRDVVFADAETRQQFIAAFWDAWHAQTESVPAR